jgi:hypothetical protein
MTAQLASYVLHFSVAHFVHPSLTPSTRTIPIHVVSIFPFRCFPSSISFHFVCLFTRFIPSSKSFIPTKKLSPSFVALVKSLLAPPSSLCSLFRSSSFLSRGGAGLRALCVCFAYVSMSNDSIPHWPMHNTFFVLSKLRVL